MRVLHEACASPRQTFCGPAAVSAITGESAEEAARCINLHRGDDLDAKVKGTRGFEVESALEFFGFECESVKRPQNTWGVVVRRDWWGSAMEYDRCYRPTVAKILPLLERGEVYWVGIATHWLVIKDGIAFDNARPDGWDISQPRARYRRGGVWNLKKVTKKE